MNEACNDGDGAATLCFNTPSELWRNWGPAGFDRRHNLQLGFVYQLPWQSTDGYGSFGKALVSDWQVNGVFGAFSGNPFTMIANGGSLNTPSNNAGNTANANLADLTGSYETTGNVGNDGAWFNTSAFAQPTGVRFGNTGRNEFYGPGGYNLDLSLFRAFPIGGHEAARGATRSGKYLQHGRVRQSAEQRHVGHLRRDHRGGEQQRRVVLSGATDSVGNSVQLLAQPLGRSRGATYPTYPTQRAEGAT